MAAASPAAVVVPRSFKLLNELEKGEKATATSPGERNIYCSYGLKNQDDVDMTDWNGTIMGPPYGRHENRIYSVEMQCGPDYPRAPPKVQFVNQINLPGVDSTNGMVDPNAIDLLRTWTATYDESLRTGRADIIEKKLCMEAVLDGLRRLMDRNKTLPQPPEGAVYGA
jgi:ubiquitin-conjugating enzyme E2 variant